MNHQPQWCTECGQPMTQRPDGAYLKCCDGGGYWVKLEPLPRDEQMALKVWRDKEGYRAFTKRGGCRA